uniref:Ring finger protein 128 n=1 Tax=Naja naja TaxID=35670 RepID=A0A8C6YEA4_NAJNA
MRRSGSARAASSLGAPLLSALLLLLTLGPPGLGPRPAGAQSVWTAWLNVSWRLPGSNVSAWSAGESGLFGQDSPVRPAAGLVVAPDAREGLNACSPRSNFSAAPAHQPWVALVQRGGGCMFSVKINAAARLRAQAVAVFNYDGAAGPEVQTMTHPGEWRSPWPRCGGWKGMRVCGVEKKGGKLWGPWCSLSLVVFLTSSALTQSACLLQRRLKADARKAIGQLQLRTLKQGDKEMGPDADSCAVCIEAYKPNDVVRILTCHHLFHKSCIDPWLLEHRTCPMCKCDILKALGIEVNLRAVVKLLITCSFAIAGFAPEKNCSALILFERYFRPFTRRKLNNNFYVNPPYVFPSCLPM